MAVPDPRPVDVRLVEAMKKLTRLLEDPMPGLMTWHTACEGAARDVERLIKECRGEKKI